MGPIVAKSPPMAALLALLRRAAAVKTTVLLVGESGTGKELLARELHRLSPRAAGAFVPVPCGAIPASLMEGELFGHRRGAFTDARADRRGLIEEAHGGTLFLDEIGELPLALQPKLLRVLQEERVRPLGAEADVVVDVRVVAATARELDVEVAAGRFREDLRYRLDVVRLDLPPLRQRPEDLAPLIDHVLRSVSARLRTPPARVAKEALAALCAYPWPGNVGEPENTIESATVLCEGSVLGLDDLPERLRPPAAPLHGAGPAAPPPPPMDADDADLSVKRATRRLEEQLIRRALQRTGGNRTSAARLLELSHRALLYKIRAYGIT